MKAKLEHTISRLTTALILSVFVICIGAFIVDEIWGIARFELVFRGLAGLAVVGLVACVLVGWILAVRYLFSRNRASATSAEYLLIVTVIFMPLAAIYVLRSIRQRESEKCCNH